MKNVIILLASEAAVLFLGIATLLFEKRTQYEGGDERQVMETYKGYALAFFVTFFINLSAYLANGLLNIPFNMMIFFPLSIYLGFISSVIYSIAKDSFYSKFSPKITLTILSLCMAIVMYRFYRNYSSGHRIEDLIFFWTFVVTYIIAVATVLLKKILSRKSEE